MAPLRFPKPKGVGADAKRRIALNSERKTWLSFVRNFSRVQGPFYFKEDLSSKAYPRDADEAMTESYGFWAPVIPGPETWKAVKAKFFKGAERLCKLRKIERVPPENLPSPRKFLKDGSPEYGRFEWSDDEEDDKEKPVFIDDEEQGCTLSPPHDFAISRKVRKSSNLRQKKFAKERKEENKRLRDLKKQQKNAASQCL